MNRKRERSQNRHHDQKHIFRTPYKRRAHAPEKHETEKFFAQKNDITKMVKKFPTRFPAILKKQFCNRSQHRFWFEQINCFLEAKRNFQINFCRLRVQILQGHHYKFGTGEHITYKFQSYKIKDNVPRFNINVFESQQSVFKNQLIATMFPTPFSDLSNNGSVANQL